MKQLKTVTLPDLAELTEYVRKLPAKYGWIMPIMKGNPTATGYASQIENFSTVTEIYRAKSGQEYFLIHFYRLAWVHRILDFLMKYLTGTRSYKVFSRKAWQNQFAKKSQITLVPVPSKHTVVMPFIPSLNLYDLIINGPTIQDFGVCGWGKELTAELAMELLVKAMEKLNGLHRQVGAWGEVITQNMIVVEKREVTICDPEVKYYNSVVLPVQRAYDLYDLLVNSCSIMNRRFQAPFEETAVRLLAAYKHDQKIVILTELAVLCSQPLSLSQKLFMGYTLVRLGLTDKSQYENIRLELAKILQAFR